MVRWIGFIRLKWTELKWLKWKLYTNFRESCFLLETAIKFRNFQISNILNTDANRIFLILSRLCLYFWDIHSLENNSVVCRSGYLYGVNPKFLNKCFSFFSKLKVLAIKIYVKIPCLLPSCFCRSTVSTRPVHATTSHAKKKCNTNVTIWIKFVENFF